MNLCNNWRNLCINSSNYCINCGRKLCLDTDNLVAIIYDGGSMGDKNDGTLVVTEDIFQYLTLRIGIKGTGSLVE